jgi:Xaa-Pro aminopeptidase
MQNNRISSLPRPFILTAFDTMQQTRDEAYPFTQEANFYWLTHINEAGWLVIGDEGEGKSGGQLHLVAPDRTDIQRLFEGGLSHAEATALSGIPSVLTQAEGEAYIQRLAKKHKKVYSLGRDPYDSYNTFSKLLHVA